MSKVIKIILSVFAGLIGVVALLMVISIFPVTGNFKFLIVLSGSMEPTIHTGSVIIVKPEAAYHKGDIISYGKFGSTNNSITHRIIEEKEINGQTRFIAQGDNNNAPDDKPVDPATILGKTVLAVPYVGYAVAAARQPWGFAVVIIVPALAIMYDELQKIVKELKRIKSDK